MRTDLDKIGIRVAPLSKQIVIARFGKDQHVALDTREAGNEFWTALCDYCFDGKMPEPGSGALVQFGGGNEQFTAIVRRFETIEEANKDTAVRAAAIDMLRVLKDFVTETRAYSHPECDECEIVGPLLRAADAAIAKAEAQSND